MQINTRTLHDMKLMSRPGMDKAKPDSRIKEFAVPIGAIFTTTMETSLKACRAVYLSVHCAQFRELSISFQTHLDCPENGIFNNLHEAECDYF